MTVSHTAPAFPVTQPLNFPVISEIKYTCTIIMCYFDLVYGNTWEGHKDTVKLFAFCEKYLPLLSRLKQVMIPRVTQTMES